MSTHEEKKCEKRWIVDDFIGRQDCAELILLHRSNAVVGYRDRFSVTTLREPLAFGNWGHLLPLIRIRDMLKDAVEERTGEHLSLFVEWTGLSCWHAHSSIPAHYDSNRPYLSQRHYSVVLYLNDAGQDFGGGTFQFFDAQGLVEEEVQAVAGRLLIFSSGPENVHGVTPITRGERYTFTVWLTRDEECWEDPKILSYLPSSLSPSLELNPARPTFVQPSVAARRVDGVANDVIGSESSAEVDARLALDSDRFDLEGEVMRQLEMEVWLREVGRKKRKKRPRDDPKTNEAPWDVGQADDATNWEEEEVESVMVSWKGRLVPLHFDSVRRATELVAFVTWRDRGATLNEEAEERRQGADTEEEKEAREWIRRVDEWTGYRRLLDEGLQLALPKWKDAGCLYDYRHK